MMPAWWGRAWRGLSLLSAAVAWTSLQRPLVSAVLAADDKPVAVPALLSAGGKILWEESLVILCQDKAYACPGAKGVSGKVEPTTLAPHQAASTTVNVLLLQGPEWPQGGYRIEFRFCLGEKSRTQSLYYMTKHHGKLRDALLQAPAAEEPAAPAKD